VTAPRLRRARRGARPARDQVESVFASILNDLVSRVPGARTAALVDSEGETVDYATCARPFDVRLAAAHWRIVLAEVRSQPSLAQARSLVVRASWESYVVHALPEGYALIMILVRTAGFSGSRRALVACERALTNEAGWSSSEGPRRSCFAVRVAQDGRLRPTALDWGGAMRRFEILGSHASGLARGERAWRIRLDNGLETTLIREPGGGWYIDDLEGTRAPGSSGQDRTD
jgi:hypothetical protein